MNENTETNTGDAGKTFTQAELDKIISERLARERSKFEAELAERDKLEQTKKDIDGKVSEALKLAGLNQNAIPIALKYYDRAAVTRDNDGNITNMQEVIQSFRGEWENFFGETHQKGADVGEAPINTPRPSEDEKIRKAMGLKP